MAAPDSRSPTMQMTSVDATSGSTVGLRRLRRLITIGAAILTVLVARPAFGATGDRAVERLIRKTHVKCFALFDMNIAHGDLTDNGESETVAVASYESSCGGNASFQRLFVFSPLDGPSGGQWKLLASSDTGGRWGRFVEHVYVEDGNSRLQGLEWTDTDPGCCPSQPFVEELLLVRRGASRTGRWVLVKAA